MLEKDLGGKVPRRGFGGLLKSGFNTVIDELGGNVSIGGSSERLGYLFEDLARGLNVVRLLGVFEIELTCFIEASTGNDFKAKEKAWMFEDKKSGEFFCELGRNQEAGSCGGSFISERVDEGPALEGAGKGAIGTEAGEEDDV